MKFFKKLKSNFFTQPSKESNSEYGYIKGTFTEGTNSLKMKLLNSKMKNKFPHYNFPIQVNDETFLVNVNVKSRDRQHPDLLVFYTENFEQDIINKKPFLEMQKSPTSVNNKPSKDLSLDYLRDNLFDLSKLAIIKDESTTNDKALYNMINKYLTEAKENNDHVAVWGFLYNDNNRKGIHDVHMNQGSTNGSTNFVGKDGGLMVCDGEKIKFLCFLVFSSQCLKTDDTTGNCKK